MSWFRASISVAVLVVTIAGAAASSATESDSSQGFEATALCVAAQERDLKARLHAQPSVAELERWQAELEITFARTGQAYLNGLSKELAKELLAASERQVAEWPQAQLSEQVRVCLREGRAVLAQASTMQKLLVRNSAQRWLNKELGRIKG